MFPINVKNNSLHFCLFQVLCRKWNLQTIRMNDGTLTSKLEIWEWKDKCRLFTVPYFPVKIVVPFPQIVNPLKACSQSPIVEIDCFALLAAILVSNVLNLAWRWVSNLLTGRGTVLYMELRWPTVPVSAQSWRSHEKKGDSEQSRISAFEFLFYYPARLQRP